VGGPRLRAWEIIRLLPKTRRAPAKFSSISGANGSELLIRRRWLIGSFPMRKILKTFRLLLHAASTLYPVLPPFFCLFRTCRSFLFSRTSPSLCLRPPCTLPFLPPENTNGCPCQWRRKHYTRCSHPLHLNRPPLILSRRCNRSITQARIHHDPCQWCQRPCPRPGPRT